MTVRDIFLASNTVLVDTGSYWIRRQNTGEAYDQARGVAVDSGAEVYIGGCSSSAYLNEDQYITRLSPAGALQWDMQIGLGGGDDENINALAVDSTDSYVYVTGNIQPSNGVNMAYVGKLATSNGSISWSRYFGGSGKNIMYGISLDSSNNVYVTGKNDDGSSNYPELFVAKFNTSGTLQWTYSVSTDSTYLETGYDIEVSKSTGTVNIAGAMEIASGGTNISVIQMDSAGTLLWTRSLSSTASTSLDQGRGIAIDSSNNLYVCGYATESDSSVSAIIAKYNSSGTLLWQRRMTSIYGSGGSKVAKAFDIDASDTGDVYITGTTTNSAGYTSAFVAKYNSAGTFQWVNTMSVASNDVAGNSIAFDGVGGLIIAGYTKSGTVYNQLHFKVPYTGAKQGTRNVGGYNFVYAEASAALVSSSGILVEVTSNLNRYTWTPSSGTPASLYSSDSTLAFSSNTLP